MNNFDLLIPQAPDSTDTWTWATVTQTNPLRIRIDGDEEALDVTPQSLTFAPLVGDRVWVQIHGRRIIVHGRGGPVNRVTTSHPWTAPIPQGDGSMYFDTQAQVIQVWSGGWWRPAGAAVVAENDFYRPGAPAQGSIAYTKHNGALSIFVDGEWKQVGQTVA